MKEHDLKWLSAGNVRHEAVLIGQIKSVSEEKQRFYRHRFIFVQNIMLQTETKLVYIKKITPQTKNLNVESFKADDVIKVYGMWEGTQFIFNQHEKVEKVT